VIVAGYQGMSYRREITTLGRGGSDTTAVALAAALGADRCEIYSDVDGVYTADPRSVPEARHLPAIDLAVLQEMAEAGAKVLNAQAVEWARRSRIVIHARRTGDRHDAEPRGRETVSGQPGADSGVRAVVAQRNVALLRVAEQQASLLLEAAARAGLALGDVAFGQTAVAAVPLLNVPDFGRVQRELSAGVPGLEVERPLGMLSLVGAGIGARPEHLQRALGLLASTPRFVISSALRLSCLLPEAELPAAERAWHAELVPRGFDQLSPASASA
jgi:aspartate kinase